ncbi:hypothetical protein POX_e06289 [Penicillium oxalicum]|uniref:Uncharacterized protein n=1 Tax=Penicillium oxalicum (strain 114-2 / CGMCC 5302) TaxID=933388 RepID=S8AZA4_PENO1|nr:hypothetical protein POX_e06289 [Penicillium oxalicum]EPS27317.1 hypothetical protein PDE_02260 [Penicillium oxalicum 114-2]KAI2788276.1 hypothetical protein POX_e06289 [Penicillium oxalicum]
MALGRTKRTGAHKMSRLIVCRQQATWTTRNLDWCLSRTEKSGLEAGRSAGVLQRLSGHYLKVCRGI